MQIEKRDNGKVISYVKFVCRSSSSERAQKAEAQNEKKKILLCRRLCLIIFNLRSNESRIFTTHLSLPFSIYFSRSTLPVSLSKANQFDSLHR